MGLAGFLNLLKPPGMTSHDVVYRVRRLLPRKTKVGHLGTLDPSATGVLPVAVGSATRLIPLLPDLGDQMKGYLAEIELGVTTDTDDLDGKVLRRSCVPDNLESSDWDRHLSAFRGAIWQVPPQVSAVRSAGKRAYELVRRGLEVDLQARQVRVARCDFRSWDPASRRLRFFLVCSTGTYVRSIARDLGRELGTGAALAFLVRTHSGPFSLDCSATLEELCEVGPEALLLPESLPFEGLSRVAEMVTEKGRTVQGEFLPGRRYLAPNGLLLGTAEVGSARVEAVFSGGQG
jgi:tRNA pseudouridine55 synthase